MQRRTVEGERRAAVGPRAAEQVQRPPRVAVDRMAVPARQAVAARREGDDDGIAHREVGHVAADRFDASGSFVAEDARERKGRHGLSDADVRVADP